MAEETFLFRNTTLGFVGAVKIDRRGDRRAIAVAPNDTVELTEEEQEVTARAPRDPGRSPFEAQPYEARDIHGEVIDSGVRAPLELVAAEDQPPTPAAKRRARQPEETGAAPEPVGAAATGSFAPGEEVGTP